MHVHSLTGLQGEQWRGRRLSAVRQWAKKLLSLCWRELLLGGRLRDGVSLRTAGYTAGCTTRAV